MRSDASFPDASVPDGGDFNLLPTSFAFSPTTVFGVAGDCVPVRLTMHNEFEVFLSPDFQPFPVELTVEPLGAALFSDNSCATRLTQGVLPVDFEDGGRDVFISTSGAAGVTNFGYFKLTASLRDAGLIEYPCDVNIRALVSAKPASLSLTPTGINDAGVACAQGKQLTFEARNSHGGIAIAVAPVNLTLTTTGDSRSKLAVDGGVCTEDQTDSFTVNWPAQQSQLSVTLDIAEKVSASIPDEIRYSGDYLASDAGILLQ